MNKLIRNIGLAFLVMAFCATAQAGIVRVNTGGFTAQAGLITFSEFAQGTVNPHYNAGDYGGGAGAPMVDFDGFFTGQSLSANPGVDCPGAAASACVVGTPTGATLTLDAASPDTKIQSDGAAPNSPVLSGNPTFNGPIAVLFSTDQAGVGFDAGFFDAIGSTAITAFARDGSLLGSVANIGLGIEFLGLVTDDGTNQIAGVFLELIGNEPAGFAIDSLRFGLQGQVAAPEPMTLGLLGLGLFGMGALRRRRAA